MYHYAAAATTILLRRNLFLVRSRIGAAAFAIQSPLSMLLPSGADVLQEHLWFAVPKKRVTRHKKRLKTTLQKRIKLREDIITDPRTGELTLRHRLPFNWKEYLPKES